MLKLASVYKYYGDFAAIAGLDLEVKKGEIVGLLGPNGAGKTTTMRVIAGYLMPDEGSVEIAGMDAYDDEIECRRIIGYMPEENPLYKDMLVDEFLKLSFKLSKVDGSMPEAIDRVVKATALEKVYYKPISHLSKGYKQRVGLAAALVSDPEILILDEPTEGLDPNQRGEIRKLITNLGKDRTVIISTHVMQEVEAMCSRIVIIADGQVVADGSKQEIMQMKGASGVYTVVIAGKGVIEKLEEMKGVREVSEIEHQQKSESEQQGGKVRAQVVTDDADQFVAALSNSLHRNKWQLYAMTPLESSLEEVFYALTTHETQDKE